MAVRAKPASGATVANNSFTDQLISLWLLQEGATTWTDYVTGGTGTTNGTGPTVTNQIAHFGGAGAIASITNPVTPSSLAFTIMIKMKPDNLVGTQSLYGDNSFGFRQNGSKFQWYNAGDSTGSLVTNAYQTLTFRRLYPSGTTDYFLDGVLDSTRSAGGTPFPNDTLNPLGIGGTTSHIFDYTGYIDYIAIWNTDLTDAAIAAITADPYAAFFGDICTGGGTIPNTADQTSGETFTGRTVNARAWLVLGYDDADRSFALDTINTTTARRIGHLLSFGSISYRLTDRFGSYRMASVSVEADDASRLFAGLEAAAASTQWVNRDVRIYLASAETIAANGTAHCVFRGIWRGYRTDGLRVSFTFTDRLGSAFSDLSLDQTIPTRHIRDDFSNRYTAQLTPGSQRIPLDTATLDKVVPISYGKVSDQQIVDDESRYTDYRRGKVSPIYVGLVTGLDSVERHEFVVCGHAITHIADAFIDDVALDLDTDILCQQSSGWAAAISADAWVTYNGRRYTTVYLATGATADAVIAGTSLLTLNYCGIEDVGDATGQTISRAPRVVWHLLNNWGIRQYETGDWPAVPASSDSVPWLNAQTFRDLETWEYAQVGGEGYELSLHLDEELTLRTLLQRLALEANMYFGQNLHGQLTAFHIPNLADLSGVETLSDAREITLGSSSDRLADELENQVVMDWDYRPADQSYGHRGDTWNAVDNMPAGWVNDANALDASNGRYVIGDRRYLKWVYYGVMAATIAAWVLELGKRVPKVATVTGPLHWISRATLGSLIQITDAELNWTDQPVWITGVDILLNDLNQAPAIRLTVEDMSAFYTALPDTGGTGALTSSDGLGEVVSASDGSGPLYAST